MSTPHDTLLAARPDDAFLRYDVLPDRIEGPLVLGRAVAWTSTHPFRRVRWLTAVADDGPAAAGAAAALVARLAAAETEPDGAGAEPPVTGLTIITPGLAALPAAIRPEAPEQWCWWVTSAAPAEQTGEADVVDLDPADPRLPPLLAESESASAAPDDPAVRRWAGVLDGDALIAAAAHVEHVPGVPHLASVVTLPAARGRGLAGALCARLTRDALAAGAPVVTLGMYSGNDVARRVYTRLGFEVVHDFVSGYLPGFGPEPGVDPQREAPADGGGTA